MPSCTCWSVLSLFSSIRGLPTHQLFHFDLRPWCIRLRVGDFLLWGKCWSFGVAEWLRFRRILPNKNWLKFRSGWSWTHPCFTQSKIYKKYIFIFRFVQLKEPLNLNIEHTHWNYENEWFLYVIPKQIYWILTKIQDKKIDNQWLKKISSIFFITFCWTVSSSNCSSSAEL